MQTSPIEFLHAIQLVNKIGFSRAPNRPFLGKNLPRASLNCLISDIRTECGFEQSSCANIRLLYAGKREQAFQTFRSIQ